MCLYLKNCAIYSNFFHFLVKYCLSGGDSMKKFLNTLNNALVDGITVLFIAFNGMFYSLFDKTDKVSIYFLLALSMVFYFIVLIIYAFFKNNDLKENDNEIKVLEIFENESGIHLILKQTTKLTLNTVCSIYYVEKNSYETFKGIGYVYNIANDKKVDIKMFNNNDKNFVDNCSKTKKNIIIKTALNIENIQYLGGNTYD